MLYFIWLSFQLAEVQESPILSEKPRENSETTTELVKFSEQVSCHLKAFEYDSDNLSILGAFGEVRMCVHRESQAQRAVKVLRKSHMDEEEKRMLFNEINILKEIVSPLSQLRDIPIVECFIFMTQRLQFSHDI